MLLLRTTTLLYLGMLAGFPVAANAQTPCTGGSAGGYSCENIDLMAVIPTGVNGPLHTGATNDIWGWTDPSNGREYALAGTRSGVVFVDITEPAAPVVLGKLLTSTDNSTWRDVKVYDNHAFVVSEASGHGMQVFDLTQLRGLSGDDNREFLEDILYRGPGNAVGDSHNIAINEESATAYIVGSDDCSGGLHMVDISDPGNPTFAGCFSADGYTHDVQCVIYNGPDADYVGREICVASNEDAITIVDVTDKSNPVEISQGFYQDVAYTHQGWFTDDQHYFLVDDESDAFVYSFPGSRTIVFDLEDLDAPELGFYHYDDVFTATHNLYIRGNYAFASNYESGLRVYDITNIDSGSFSSAGYFDTYPDGNSVSFSGQWSNYPYFPSGTIIANDQDFGLFILKTTFPITTDTAVYELPGDTGFELSGAYPNPFSSSTRLNLVVAESQSVTAELIDITGRAISTLYKGAVSAGQQIELQVDAQDLPSGLYIIRVIGEHFQTTKRISLVR